jgi:uncharacterized protein (DUF1778 family)
VSTTNKQQQLSRRRASSSRVNLRIDPMVKTLLVKAAGLQQVKLSEFMVRASRIAAEGALADRARFVLTPEKWREFNAALDSPPRTLPALRKLFQTASVFDAA